MFDVLTALGICVIPIGLLTLIVQLLLRKSVTAGRVILGTGLLLVGLGLFLKGLTGAWDGSLSSSPTVTRAEERGEDAPASVPEPEGITKAQYDSIELGMTLEEVEQELGEGELVSEAESSDMVSQVWVWKGTAPGSSASMVLLDGRVETKSQVGLS